jgi:hypothetical protein
MSVIHPPRVAWQGACAFVAAANGDTYWWLNEMLGRYLGLMFELYLTDTRARLQRGVETYAEIGIWRASCTTCSTTAPSCSRCCCS